MSTPDEDAEDLPTDYRIAKSVETKPIWEITEPFGLDRSDLDLYGDNKAKLTQSAIDRLSEADQDSKLVLVTGMTPTPLGEGKTVTTIGLGQAFNQLDRQTMICIREPSLGPVFGIKGGAAGGGWSQVLPMEDINLHFTGDIHALTAAHNLISAMLDTHLAKGNELDIDVNEVVWKRSIDMNDRALRQTVIGLGGRTGGTPREDGFLLTAASELMAVLCLADSLEDLKERISRIIVAYDTDGEPITAGDIEAAGAAAILLRDALRPNVVQTIEGTPAFVHGGPFANIAHGTNSLIADQLAFGMGEYVVTEAGFGSDLGAEKFMNVVCRFGEMSPDAVVIVATIRALKYHGLDMWPADQEALAEPNVEAVRNGFENLDKHIENLQKFGVPVVVAINRFPQDTDEEVAAVIEHCESDLGVRAAESNVFGDGGEGGIDLAEQVIDAAESGEADFEYLYDASAPIKEKIETIATEIYGAGDVKYVGSAEDDIEQLEAIGMDDTPVVMSKTFHSFTDDSTIKGAPEGWELEVKEVYPSAGAGFVVALTGDVLTLPGLPARPAAADMDIDADGTISGLF